MVTLKIYTSPSTVSYANANCGQNLEPGERGENDLDKRYWGFCTRTSELTWVNMPNLLLSVAFQYFYFPTSLPHTGLKESIPWLWIMWYSRHIAQRSIDRINEVNPFSTPYQWLDIWKTCSKKIILKFFSPQRIWITELFAVLTSSKCFSNACLAAFCVEFHCQLALQRFNNSADFVVVAICLWSIFELWTNFKLFIWDW